VIALRLVSVRIDHYKRFGEPVLLRIRGRTLAVLGHNESGKTSLLMAIAHVGRNGFAAATEFTDRTPLPPTHRVLSSRFELEVSDVEAINAGLADRFFTGDLAAGSHWHVYKRSGGDRRFEVVGQLRRDVQPRKELAGLLDSSSGADWDSMPLSEQSEEQQARVRTAMQHLATSLSTDVQTLPEDTLDELTSLKTDIDQWAEAAGGSNAQVQDLQQRLARVEADERSADPGRVAADILFARLPPFIVFDEAARVLPSFTPFTDAPSTALVNLLAAGGTTFDELASFAGRDDGREALSEEEKQVNLRLEELFDAWSQRKVCAVIQVDPTGIGVIGRDRTAPIPDPPLSQRSEGMRTFAALLTFLHAKKAEWSNLPVLLVDEAELHLHYDAQADLVQVFDRQELAQCVIYTTHSVGCLPEDLGLGIVVVEESGNERSQVSQSFWTRGPGLTPVLLALGATALSFTPARRAMIGEGAHEAILLPTLLRQTREGVPAHTPLGLQIVGGLSEISATAAERLEEEAGTVLYVVDNDDGGRDVARILPERARNTGRVMTLGDGTTAECIEDFVSASILVRALDNVLETDGRTVLGLEATDVPESGRARWLEQKLSSAGSDDARTRLAQAAVIMGASGDLAEPARAPALRALLAAASAAFPDYD
jgi:AAA domain, putative AbiEii toxin, Type IV TA system